MGTFPKWVNEIKVALPEAKITVINSTEEALRHVRELNARPPQGLEFTVVGTDRAKLGPEPWAAALWRRVRGEKYFAWHCPDCLKPVYDGRDVDKNPLGWEAFACGQEPEPAFGPRTPNSFPRRFSVRWNNHPAVKRCPECGSKLQRPALKSKGETPNRPRWYVCRILRRARFDLFIRLDRSELARFARDAHSALAADLADCLASADLGLKWQELARKDMDANLKLVAEKDFKEAVRAAQKELVTETLRLCGKDASVTLIETGSGLPVARAKIVVSRGGGRGRRAVAAGQLAFDFFAN